MKKILALVFVAGLLAGCSNPANREIRACEDFFAIPPLPEVTVQVQIEKALDVAEAHNGTSIGRAVGEFGRSYQKFMDDLKDWQNTGVNWLDDDYRAGINVGIYMVANDQKTKIISRCDDLLTGR